MEKAHEEVRKTWRPKVLELMEVAKAQNINISKFEAKSTVGALDKSSWRAAALLVALNDSATQGSRKKNALLWLQFLCLLVS